MLGKALCEHLGMDEAEVLRTSRLTEFEGVLPADFTHAGSSIADGRPFNDLPSDFTRFRNQRVLFLVRDPRDVLVSCYFQATKRLRTYDGSLGEFVRDARYGARKVAAFHRLWAENQDVPADFSLIRYEGMRANPKAALTHVLSYLGLSDIPDPLVDAAVAFAEFDNMQSLEARGVFQADMLLPGNPADPESYKVRRGKVGGYQEYLQDDDCRFVDKTIAEEGGPFLLPYVPRSAGAE